MGILSALLPTKYRATYADYSDFWFQKEPAWSTSLAGFPSDPEAAMRLGAVYACVSLIADMVGLLPLHLFRRLDDEDSKEKARTHPVYPLLRWQPNPRQTAFEWRSWGVVSLLLRGNFYSKIIEDNRGRITELRPMHPDRTTAVLLDSGRRGYTYRPLRGPEQRLVQEEVLHVMGLSTDPEAPFGMSVIEHARETIGRSQAEEAFAATFWRKSGEPPGVLTAPGALTDKQVSDMRTAWESRGRHNIAILQGGLKYEQLGLTNKDAEFVASRQFSVADIARWFRVPPHMIGDVERSTSWGSGISEMTIGFVNFTLMPWLVEIEQAIQRDLLDGDDELFAKFLVDAIERGDAESRSREWRTWTDGGIKSVNEARIAEDLNPLEGDEFDKPLRAQNIGGGGDPATTETSPERPRPSRVSPRRDEEEDDLEEAAQSPRQVEIRVVDRRDGQDLMRGAATLAVRREVGAIRRQATPKHVADVAGWRSWLDGFYARHAAHVSEMLSVPLAEAQLYAKDHRADLLARGLEVLPEWERDAPDALVALAVGGQVPASAPPLVPTVSRIEKTIHRDDRGRPIGMTEVHHREG